MARFNQGETIVLSIHSYQIGLDGVLGSPFSPDTSMTVEIINPLGVVVVTTSAMIQDTTGVYYYNHPTTTDDELGTYQVVFTAIDGNLETVEYYSFVLGR